MLRFIADFRCEHAPGAVIETATLCILDTRRSSRWAGLSQWCSWWRGAIHARCWLHWACADVLTPTQISAAIEISRNLVKVSAV